MLLLWLLLMLDLLHPFSQLLLLPPPNLGQVRFLHLLLVFQDSLPLLRPAILTAPVSIPFQQELSLNLSPNLGLIFWSRNFG